MAKRKVKYKNVVAAFFIFVFLLLMILVSCIWFYQSNLKAVSKESKKIELKVEKGSTYQSLSTILEEKGLIRSSLMYKIYIKFNHPTSLQAGSYMLYQNMSVEEIISNLEKGSNYNPDVIKITFKEGLVVPKVAEIIEKNTNHKKEEVYKLLKDTTYLNKLIDKYWFLTDDIKNSKLYYSLEGYLYPNTYEYLNKDVKIETIIESMLDSMEVNLKDDKEAILKSKYSIHEIITLASMIQSEGNNTADFKKMASVFLTRLDKKMQLQSCASAYYGDKKIMGVDAFLDSYLKKNNYNTYVIDALPVGPISNPGLDAIQSVLNPSYTDYLYFASDKNMKVYFSKTYEEHAKTVAQLKKSGNWYGS